MDLTIDDGDYNELHKSELTEFINKLGLRPVYDDMEAQEFCFTSLNDKEGTLKVRVDLGLTNEYWEKDLYFEIPDDKKYLFDDDFNFYSSVAR